MRYAVKMLDLPSAPARMAIRDVLFIKASGDVQIVNARIACAAASYTFDGQAAFEVAEYDHVCLCGPNWSYLADSGGNIEITGEYTVETPGRFFFEHPDESLRGPIWVTRFQLSLDNTAKAALDVADYGKLLALTNGMKFQVLRGDFIIQDLFGGSVVKNNGDLLTRTTEISTAIKDRIGVVWRITETDARGFRLFPGERICLTAQDDLSALAVHRVNVGWIVE